MLNQLELIRSVTDVKALAELGILFLVRILITIFILLLDYL